MKFLTALFAFLTTIAIAIPTGTAAESAEDWLTFYYKSPSPDAFSEQVRAMSDKGMLKNESAQPPIVAFLSQVMAANPEKVSGWLEEFKNLDEQQRKVLLEAAWYSNTETARDFFTKQKLDEYLKKTPSIILEMEVNDSSTLDMLWGYFMATGEVEPIRRIVSAFDLAKYSGAVQRYSSSEKTEKDKQEAYWDATFQAAKWSLESNCRQHPLVWKHCDNILKNEKLSKDQRHWLGVVLSNVKEHHALQGLWQAIALEANGEAAPPLGFQIQIEGNALVFNPATENRKHTFDIDPMATPKELNLTLGDGPDKGKVLPCAIYELDGDKLTICLEKEWKLQKRPTEFKTLRGDGCVLLTLERVKDKE